MALKHSDLLLHALSVCVSGFPQGAPVSCHSLKTSNPGGFVYLLLYIQIIVGPCVQVRMCGCRTAHAQGKRWGGGTNTWTLFMSSVVMFTYEHWRQSDLSCSPPGAHEGESSEGPDPLTTYFM